MDDKTNFSTARHANAPNPAPTLATMAHSGKSCQHCVHSIHDVPNNCRTLLQMHTMMCLCVALYDLMQPTLAMGLDSTED